MENKKPMSTREALLRNIERFLKLHPGLTPENFGWKALRDTTIVERLRNGGDITTRKLDDIIRYMSTTTQRKDLNHDSQETETGKARQGKKGSGSKTQPR